MGSRSLLPATCTELAEFDAREGNEKRAIESARAEELDGIVRKAPSSTSLRCRRPNPPCTECQHLAWQNPVPILDLVASCCCQLQLWHHSHGMPASHLASHVVVNPDAITLTRTTNYANISCKGAHGCKARSPSTPEVSRKDKEGAHVAQLRQPGYLMADQ